MNINKGIIDKLVQSNKNVAKLFQSLEKLKEEELNLILEEISKLKNSEQKIKREPKKIDIDKKITNSIVQLSSMIPKNVELEKIKPINIIKSIVRPVVKNVSTQSSQNYTRKDTENIQEEKLIVMKSIRDHLNTKKINPDVPKKEGAGSGLLNGLGSGAIGATVGGILSKGKGVVKKFGIGRALSIAYAVKSGYDLISGIKQGYNDYKKFKANGDNVSANNVLFKTFISSSGSLMDVLGAVIPGPIGWLLMGGGFLLDSIAGDFDSVMADKNNQLIQDQQKVAKVEDLINQGEKNQILLLRPNVKNMSWEYKNYANDSWDVIKDSLGNHISIATDRIQPNEKSVDGIQTYKLKTSGKQLDMVLSNGVPKIKDGDNLREITPRRNGGKVNSGKDYLVGEDGPELYREKSDKQIGDVFFSINKSFKKLVNGFNVDALVEFFTPQITTYKIVRNSITPISSGKELLNFSNISSDKTVRFDSFIEQLFAFEGGYADEKNDLGGKTKYGVSESVWKKYGKDINPNAKEVKDISREDAKKIYEAQYYKNTKAEKIDDPKLAYVYFDTSVIMGQNDADEFLKKSGGDVDKFLELRKNRHVTRTIEKPTQLRFKEGWLNRVESMQNMVQKSYQQAKLESDRRNIQQIQTASKDMVDSEFILNNIVPAMAEMVSKQFGI